MERYGEYLFDASSGSIKQCLSDINEDDIRDCSDYQVFKRGKTYNRDGMVEGIFWKEQKNLVEARVDGTDLYRLEFYLEHGEVWASCDCPYDDVCKHMVAALLEIINEGLETIIEAPPGLPSQKESADIIQKFLKTLSKKELAGLVMKFAPLEYLEEIRNRNAPEIDAGAIFKKVEKEIKKCFNDDELLFDPEGMEGALMKNLKKLKGLEKNLQKEIGELLLYIVRSVDQAFDEGYLYLDDWYNDSYFESEEYCEYVIAYVAQLPFEDRMSYVLLLNHELDKMSYDTFSSIESSYSRFFGEHEKERLILFVGENPLIHESLLSRLYEFLESGLRPQDQETILKKLAGFDQKHVNTLCDLYLEQERYQETHELIMKYVHEKDRYADPHLVLIYLEVSHKLGLDPLSTSIKALTWRASLQILLKIKELNGSVDPACETLVRDSAPEDLLSFYEQEKRMKDALNLVGELDSFHDFLRFAFFRKHGKLFPEETEAYLVARIEENLNHTGKKYYSLIAESLDLFKRINPERTIRIAEEIRTNFKRRRNLMQMISDF